MNEKERVIAASEKVSGAPALDWYQREPLAAFGGLTAAQLVADGRADDVLRYLASIEDGAAG